MPARRPAALGGRGRRRRMTCSRPGGRGRDQRRLAHPAPCTTSGTRRSPRTPPDYGPARHPAPCSPPQPRHRRPSPHREEQHRHRLQTPATPADCSPSADSRDHESDVTRFTPPQPWTGGPASRFARRVSYGRGMPARYVSRHAVARQPPPGLPLRRSSRSGWRWRRTVPCETRPAPAAGYSCPASTSLLACFGTTWPCEPWPRMPGPRRQEIGRAHV